MVKGRNGVGLSKTNNEPFFARLLPPPPSFSDVPAYETREEEEEVGKKNVGTIHKIISPGDWKKGKWQGTEE